jgi:hypothetical protein
MKKTKNQILDECFAVPSAFKPENLVATFESAMMKWGDQEYNEALTHVDLFETVRAVGSRIKDDRNQYKVLASATEELGELAQEIRVANGDSYKPEGKDGVVGEAVDLIACALDLIYITKPNITSAELNDMLRPKCAKWLKNTPESFVI